MKHANRIIAFICFFGVLPYVLMSQIVPDKKIYSNGKLHEFTMDDGGTIHLVIGDSYGGAYYLQLDTSYQAISDTFFLYQSQSSKALPSIDNNTEHIGINWYESGGGSYQIPNGRITGALIKNSVNPTIDKFVNFDDKGSDLGVFWDPNICFLNDTLLLATWSGYSDKYDSDPGTYGQLMTIKNELIGSNFDIIESDYIEAGGNSIKTCSLKSNSDFISIWTGMHTGDMEIYGRIFNHTGTAKDSSFLITTETSVNHQYFCSLDTDNNGNILIVWSGDVNSEWNVFYRWYDSLGSPLTDILSITDNSHEVNSFSEVDCFVSDNGKSIIEWENVENGKKCIYAQRFNNDRSPLGKPFRVTSRNSLNDQIVPRVLLNNDRIYTFWQGSGASWANVLDFYDPESSVDNNALPLIFFLSQNYPNPFNPSTALSYQLSSDSEVKLTIYDISGRKVAALINDHVSAGSYETVWDAAGFPSGIYFARLSCGEKSVSTKMVLLK
jgi:hypothetical protein